MRCESEPAIFTYFLFLLWFCYFCSWEIILVIYYLSDIMQLNV